MKVENDYSYGHCNCSCGCPLQPLEPTNSLPTIVTRATQTPTVQMLTLVTTPVFSQMTKTQSPTPKAASRRSTTIKPTGFWPTNIPHMTSQIPSLDTVQIGAETEFAQTVA